MRNIVTILTAASFLSLQGCVFAVGAAAGAVGVAAVYDHRKIENIVKDQHIVNAIADKVNAVPDLRDNSHIDINCFNQVVLLTGETPSEDLRKQAEELAHSVPDVTHVYNEITVQGPTSSLTRTSDTWITTKIKSQMLTMQDLKSGTIKVVTENGSVYLMGIVTKDQAEMAVNIARGVAGVQRVVKMFQYKN